MHSHVVRLYGHFFHNLKVVGHADSNPGGFRQHTVEYTLASAQPVAPKVEG